MPGQEQEEEEQEEEKQKDEAETYDEPDLPDDCTGEDKWDMSQFHFSKYKTGTYIPYIISAVAMLLLLITGVFGRSTSTESYSMDSGYEAEQMDNWDESDHITETEEIVSDSEEAYVDTGYSDIVSDFKDMYTEIAEMFGSDFKKTYQELANEYTEMIAESGIYEDTVALLKESYEMLYEESAPLFDSLQTTREYMNSVISDKKTKAVQEIVNSIDDPDIKAILQYALMAKDLKTNYSDYSIENVSPEFKEKMDRLETYFVELGDVMEEDDNDESLDFLYEYRDLLDATKNLDTVYTEDDDLSTADREYFDIVMLRIAAMIVAME
jgi:hypothetical protein